jgi:hypothetical protein
VRRRVWREVGTIAGAAVILGVLVFTNNFVQRKGLAEQMVAVRENLEKQQEKQGKVSILKWPLLQKTRGGYSKGPTFIDDLKQYNGQPVNLIGFQVPVEQFRDMTEFLLLPMPIECYFCQSPPMKDVVLVQMAEGEVAPLYKEPVLISGTLQLHEGPKTQFFYTVKDAHWGKASEKMKMHRKNVPIEHQLPHNKNEEPLLEGTQVPEAASVEDVLKGADTTETAPTVDGPVTTPEAPAAETPAPAAPAAPVTAPAVEAPAPAPAPEADAAAAPPPSQ